MRTSLRAQLAALRPSEVILPSHGLTSVTKKVMMACLRSPRVNSLAVDTAFWSAGRTLEELASADYFKGKAQNHKYVTPSESSPIVCVATIYPALKSANMLPYLLLAQH